MTSCEAALYFAIYWLIWPFLILVYVPTAVLLSPVYAVVLTIDAFAWLIEVLQDGEDINAHVDEADEKYDDAVDSRDYDPDEEDNETTYYISQLNISKADLIEKNLYFKM